MSSAFRWNGDVEWFSNRIFDAVWEHGVDTAKFLRVTGPELAEVHRVIQILESGAFWPGIVVDLAVEFPRNDQRKLWAWAFLETAQSLFLRELGDHRDTHWQVDVICGAQRAGHFFESTVTDLPRWHARTRTRDAANAEFRRKLDLLKGDMAD